MDQKERQVVDELFGKLSNPELQATPRDTEADRLIRAHVARQPESSYYMAGHFGAGARTGHRPGEDRAARG
ncbi:hypothetical protein SAMN07250955_101548 [Arboricoccus pini]|uniref:Uncharacterized protein n=1 Tax=Arboricoccus pini TaxID=1963835 RepID=A0A212QBE9_9PROT|nr:DUF2076 family protein [Arboricoccus pini]SNB56745.1 hypothetical protein SAMN07250955_101548 [Arboricoccus pini]